MQDAGKYMLAALKEAKKADIKEEIPVGAIIVKDGKIIARAHNSKERKNDATKHAEMIAIQKASKRIGDWRLKDCSLFVTMEPCVMCVGAIIEARIPTVYCGIKNNRYHSDIEKIVEVEKISINFGLFEDKCEEIMKKFFEKKRKK